MALAITGGSYGVAFAQSGPDPVTKGVSQATANSACAAIVDDPVPSTTNEAAFRAAANTPTGTDDVGFEGKVSPDWQALINQQEMHRDFIGAAGLQDNKTFSCNGAVARFPQLKIATDVQDAICANERLDLIGKAVVKDRVSTALTTLGRSYADARADCKPVTPPPAKDEFNCPDFPLADGTTAQAFLDKDKSDPSKLDSDKDGKACELGDDGFVPPKETTTQNPPPPDVTPPAVNPPAVVNNNTNTVNPPQVQNAPQVQNVPVGGVETGDGSLA